MALRKKKDDTPFDKMTFEEAIESLTEIVDQIENGQVPLAESLQKYEKGMAIIRHCRRILVDAEKRIEEIAEDQQACPPANQPQTEEEEAEEDEHGRSSETEQEDDQLF